MSGGSKKVREGYGHLYCLQGWILVVQNSGSQFKLNINQVVSPEFLEFWVSKDGF